MFKKRAAQPAENTVYCPDCWAEQGQPHDLSCPMVSLAEFRAKLEDQGKTFGGRS